MKLGIMQPYFVPYLGYWQLLAAVDRYVIYDDVNFIKGGWINRNRILLNGEPKYFNVPLIGASPNKLIKEVGVNNGPQAKEKNLRILAAAYSKAPHFNTVLPLMEEILGQDEENLARYLSFSIRRICEYLEIETQLLISSEIEKDLARKGQEKVIDICKILGATDYYNAIGGKSLYDRETFAAAGVHLHFLNSETIVYAQGQEAFFPNLSIIDVLMYNDRRRVISFLNNYTLED